MLRRFAVPRSYHDRAALIHAPLTPAEIAGLGAGETIVRERHSVRTRAELPREALRLFFGPAGARLMRTLYKTANDEPFWRSDRLLIRSADLIDRYGLARSRRGYHQSRSRERVLLLLRAASTIEISVPGRDPQPLITVSGLEGSRRLPGLLTIRLAFYDEVSRGPGRGGGRWFALVDDGPAPRAGRPDGTLLLQHYLIARQLQVRRSEFVLREALLFERSQVPVTRRDRARRSLVRMLERLRAAGTISDFLIEGRGADAVVRVRMPATVARPAPTGGERPALAR